MQLANTIHPCCTSQDQADIARNHRMEEQERIAMLLALRTADELQDLADALNFLRGTWHQTIVTDEKKTLELTYEAARIVLAELNALEAS